MMKLNPRQTDIVEALRSEGSQSLERLSERFAVSVQTLRRDGTLRDYDFREVKVAQAILRQSREAWAVADTSKFDRPAMVEVAQLSQVDKLFVDSPVPPEIRRNGRGVVRSVHRCGRMSRIDCEPSRQ